MRKGKSNMKPFAGKVALVTGGSSGIGEAAAKNFAQKGAHVVVTARSHDLGAHLVARLTADGGEACFLPVDVSSAVSVDRLFETIMERFGRLDFAFNNAGVIMSGRTEEIGEADWDLVVNTNMKGVWLCMKHEARIMRAQSSGVIVNNASVAGVVGISGAAAYCASKHAVVGLTKAAALELATAGVRVNAVCPGFIETPVTQPILQNPEGRAQVAALQPMGRHGSSEEVANAVAWLCSDEASFITGHPLVIDGGYVTG